MVFVTVLQGDHRSQDWTGLFEGMKLTASAEETHIAEELEEQVWLQHGNYF